MISHLDATVAKAFDLDEKFAEHARQHEQSLTEAKRRVMEPRAAQFDGDDELARPKAFGCLVNFNNRRRMKLKHGLRADRRG
jgi:sRNA-binding protein